jgi:hypothetical protein
MSKSMSIGNRRFLLFDDTVGECLEKWFLSCVILLEVGTRAWVRINCASRLEVGARDWAPLLIDGF